MSNREPAPKEQQPDSFAFSADNLAQAKMIIARYPAGRQASAVMPLLDLAQRQHENWLPLAAIDHVAELLDMPAIRVFEVATFYTMYNMQPVGKYFVQICTNTPCMIRNSDAIVAAAEEQLGIGFGETTDDGLFTLAEMECLGACVNAPMMQINDDFYEDLNADRTKAVLAALAKGETPAPGPQNSRRSSEPDGGATTLRAFIDGGDD